MVQRFSLAVKITRYLSYRPALIWAHRKSSVLLAVLFTVIFCIHGDEVTGLRVDPAGQIAATFLILVTACFVVNGFHYDSEAKEAERLRCFVDSENARWRKRMADRRAGAEDMEKALKEAGWTPPSDRENSDDSCFRPKD